MLYIIAGPVKSGKTLLRKTILENKKISGISTDFLRSMIDPQMHNESIEKNRETMKPYLLNFMNEIIEYSNEDYVVEGDMFDIELIELLKNDKDIKIIILGYQNINVNSKIEEIKFNIKFKNSWIHSCTENYLKEKINLGIKESKKLKEFSIKNNILFFDTSKKFDLKKMIEMLIK